MESNSYIGIAIYKNGYLNLSLISSKGIFYGTNGFHLLVNISSYQGDEAGEYFVITYILNFQIYECHPYFFSSSGFLLSHVEMLQIQTTGKSLLLYVHFTAL